MSINNLPLDVLTQILTYSGNFQVPEVCKRWNNALKNTKQISFILSEELQDLYKHSPHTKLINSMFPTHLQLKSLDPILNQIQCIFQQFLNRAQKLKLQKELKNILKNPQYSFAQKIYNVQKAIIFRHDAILYEAMLKHFKTVEKFEKFQSEIKNDPLDIKVQKTFKQLEEEDKDSIETLDLNKKDLLTIPPKIKELKNLKILYLEENDISFLSSDIKNLTSLQELYLNGNQLKDLPRELVELTALDTLELRKNKFSDFPLPDCFPTSLKNLDLSQNQIQSVPSSVKQLSFLDDLNLNGNFLKTLPPEIAQVNASYENNPFFFLPSQVYPPQTTENYDAYTQYVFNLSKDINLIEQQIRLPPRLIHMMNLWINSYSTTYPEKTRKDATNAYLTYLKTLKNFRDQLIERAKNEKTLSQQFYYNHGIIDLLFEIMSYKSENELFNQQIIEVIIDVMKSFPEDSVFIESLNNICIEMLKLNKNPNEPYIGLKKFLANPLDPIFIDVLFSLLSHYEKMDIEKHFPFFSSKKRKREE